MVGVPPYKDDDQGAMLHIAMYNKKHPFSLTEYLLPSDFEMLLKRCWIPLIPCMRVVTLIAFSEETDH